MIRCSQTLSRQLLRSSRPAHHIKRWCTNSTTPLPPGYPISGSARTPDDIEHPPVLESPPAQSSALDPPDVVVGSVAVDSGLDAGSLGGMSTGVVQVGTQASSSFKHPSGFDFDTHKLVKFLKQSGMEEKQAEALSDAMASIIGESMKQMQRHVEQKTEESTQVVNRATETSKQWVERKWKRLEDGNTARWDTLERDFSNRAASAENASKQQIEEKAKQLQEQLGANVKDQKAALEKTQNSLQFRIEDMKREMEKSKLATDTFQQRTRDDFKKAENHRQLDMSLEKSRVNADIQALQSRMQSEIHTLHNQHATHLTKIDTQVTTMRDKQAQDENARRWLIGVLVSCIGIIAAVLRMWGFGAGPSKPPEPPPLTQLEPLGEQKGKAKGLW
eukprot:TRINITY_DN103613_c0_g1_i1.p1 TRINITY_DN103613_c0_g1~~TRINITY_DN103613_c0_g1_i1.p1  ORF type:complete len:389 (+),score=36.89 TRINITY_DN103613_c0_g1_i1:47-1213(+)